MTYKKAITKFLENPTDSVIYRNMKTEHKGNASFYYIHDVLMAILIERTIFINNEKPSTTIGKHINYFKSEAERLGYSIRI